MSEFIQHLINGLSLGSVYALIAIGYSMVYGILQLINFAHGEVVMLGAVFAFFSARHFVSGEPSFLQVLAISMILCALIGFLIERLAYRPIRKAPRMNCLITAIGVSLFIQYFTQLDFIFGAIPQPFPELIRVEPAFHILDVPVTNLQVLILTLSISLVAILQWIVQKTKLGKGMRAVSESTEYAAMLGVPVNRVISFTFIVAGALAAAAGIMACMMYPRVDAMMGSLLGLKAFVAAVLGGIGNLPGAVLGGVMMGLAESLTVGYFSSAFRDAIAFAILIGVLLIRPSGLLGKFRMEKV
mgnify:CR=1 FL=1